MSKIYYYIGSADLMNVTGDPPYRCHIRADSDVCGWITQTNQEAETNGLFVATFVVAVDGKLWIADRRSEHVQFARGGNVLSAGEMGFATHRKSVEVVEVSNQSTGYCSEAQSYAAVNAALAKTGINYPHGFTRAFVFRRCPRCKTTNIVKEDEFICGYCDEVLPNAWNFL